MKLFRKLSLAAPALVLLGTALAQTPAAHADDWCWGDPVFSINGMQTRAIVGLQGPPSSVAGVTANIVVYVPAGVSTAIVVPPATTPFRETLSFVTQGTYSGSGPIPVTVTVSFNSAVQLPTSMQMTYPSGNTSVLTGMSNGMLTTSFRQMPNDKP